VIPSVIGGIFGRSGYTGQGEELLRPDLNPGDIAPCVKFLDDPGSELCTGYTPDCYTLGSWSGKIADNFSNAAKIMGGTPFLDKMCTCRKQKPLYLLWSSKDPAGGHCGESMTGYLDGDALIFNPQCSGGFTTYPNYVLWLLAHEFGHKYYGCRPAGYEAALANQASDPNLNSGFGTYVLDSCFLDANAPGTTYRPNENFADLIANYFVVNAWDCDHAFLDQGYENFWNNLYPWYRDYAKLIF
jgi:hypothetical protein